MFEAFKGLVASAFTIAATIFLFIEFEALVDANVILKALLFLLFFNAP